MFLKNKYILVLVLIFILIQTIYLVYEYFVAGSFGVPLDDVWIHFRFAENFSKAHFFEYNPGEPTPGTTSPLWVIVLSVPFLIKESLIIPYALFTSSLFLIIFIIKLYKACEILGFSQKYAFIISLLTLLNGRLLWSSLSGMEITFFILITILILSNHLKELSTGRLKISTGLFLAIASNIRPEAYLLAIIYFVITFFLLRKNTNWKFKTYLLSLLLFIILSSPYPVFSYIHTGSFLPNTYKGQVGSIKYFPDFRFLTETSKLFIKDNIIIFSLWIMGSIYFIYRLIRGKTEKKFILIYLWIILLPIVSSFVAPNWRHHGRYLIPLIPFINIASIHLLLEIFSRKSPKINLLAKVSLTFTFIFAFINAGLFASALGWNVENINNQQLKTAKWLKDNLPYESAFGMNDIGAITFITKKYCVDMAGLVTPEVFEIQKLNHEKGSEEMFKLLKSKNVNYIIIYPDWFEFIVNNYKTVLEPVYSAKLEKNTICGGSEKFVYKILWDKIKFD